MRGNRNREASSLPSPKGPQCGRMTGRREDRERERRREKRKNKEREREREKLITVNICQTTDEYIVRISYDML